MAKNRTENSRPKVQNHADPDLRVTDNRATAIFRHFYRQSVNTKAKPYTGLCFYASINHNPAAARNSTYKLTRGRSRMERLANPWRLLQATEKADFGIVEVAQIILRERSPAFCAAD